MKKITRGWFNVAPQFNAFLWNAWRLVLVVRGVIGTLILLIVANGLAIAYFEHIRVADGLYFTFITAFTIGYGDIVPVTPMGRVLCLLVGFLGLVMTGLVIAISTRALAETVRKVEVTPREPRRE